MPTLTYRRCRVVPIHLGSWPHVPPLVLRASTDPVVARAGPPNGPRAEKARDSVGGRGPLSVPEQQEARPVAHPVVPNPPRAGRPRLGAPRANGPTDPRAAAGSGRPAAGPNHRPAGGADPRVGAGSQAVRRAVPPGARRGPHAAMTGGGVTLGRGRTDPGEQPATGEPRAGLRAAPLAPAAPTARAGVPDPATRATDGRPGRRWCARAGGASPAGGRARSGTGPKGTDLMPRRPRAADGPAPAPTSSFPSSGCAPTIVNEGSRGDRRSCVHPPTGRCRRPPSSRRTSPTSWPRPPGRTGTSSGTGSPSGWPPASAPTSGSGTGTPPGSCKTVVDAVPNAPSARELLGTQPVPPGLLEGRPPQPRGLRRPDRIGRPAPGADGLPAGPGPSEAGGGAVRRAPAGLARSRGPVRGPTGAGRDPGRQRRPDRSGDPAGRGREPDAWSATRPSAISASGTCWAT